MPFPKLDPITKTDAADLPAGTQFRPIFKCEGTWCGNNQKFDTWAEANDSAQSRFMAWTVPTECGVAVVETSS